MNWFEFLIILQLTALFENKKLSEEENDERLEQCGLNMKSKIYQGGDVGSDEAPWAVLVYGPSSSCSGTILSPRHVMTATHCVANYSNGEWISTKIDYKFDREKCMENDNYIITELMASKVYIADRNGDFLGRAKFLFMFQFCRIITNKNAYQIQGPDDFMIVELSEDIEYSTHVQPACVARDLDDNEEEKKFMFYGYGKNPPDGLEKHSQSNETAKLRKEEVKISRMNVEGTVNRIDERLFRARSVHGNSVACSGDSGGGAIRTIDGRKTVIGVLLNTTCGFMNRGKDAFETYASVGFYSEDVCQLTGVCTPPRESSSFNHNFQTTLILVLFFFFL